MRILEPAPGQANYSRRAVAMRHTHSLSPSLTRIFIYSNPAEVAR
jgi:hypothetical protein